MADGEWRTGKTERVLAEEWGIAVGQVRKHAAEAGRWLSGAYENRDELRARVLAKLESLGDKAEGVGELRTAVQAVRYFADVASLVNQKHEHDVRATVQVERLSEDQKRQMLQAAIEKGRRLLDATAVAAAALPAPEEESDE
jgi:molybdopterin converting factor small subunit